MEYTSEILSMDDLEAFNTTSGVTLGAVRYHGYLRKAKDKWSNVNNTDSRILNITTVLSSRQKAAG